jgi:diguanylate cyclase (GGDEF)-like protein
MRATSVAVSEQIGRLLLLVVAAVSVVAFAFTWWAADRIDNSAVEQQRRSVTVGLREVADRVPVEQDSSAIWDDAVINLRANNEAWLAENLGEWMSEYFGHDRVYLLDSSNRSVRSVQRGQQVETESYEQDRPFVEPLVTRLRQEMASASARQVDSTEAVNGLGTIDKVALADGQVAIVSVRPIIPSSASVVQVPGSEFLHVSVLLLNQAVSDAIGERFAIERLTFGTAGVTDPQRTSAPVLNQSGRILGFFSWQPYRPALALIQQMAPALIGVGLLAASVLLFLVTRLRRTSALLAASEGNATFLAFHDALTRLPNRALFADRLKQATATWRRSGVRFALHVIDLDRFKHVNDTLGHPAGDELMRQVSDRLGGLVKEVDTAARIGGDEFAIIQVDVKEVGDALSLSQKVVSELQRPFDLMGHEALIGASVGVALSDHGGSDADDLLRQADVALYEAKTSGRGRYQLFAGELDLAVQERKAIELDLRAALNGAPGLELAYQPIYRANGPDVLGAEALIRWNRGKHGRLSPAMFIPLAEERGLIDQLGLWVLRQACAFAVTSPLPWVAVNVSPLQFRSERFAESVFKVLAESGLPPRRLEIEITEGLLLQNSPQVQATLNQLRAAGIRVALDDFGTGYSSISYLRSHGVDKLKIDQSFVAKLTLDSEIDNIVRCIIGLANAMNMKVTAEGVETEEQAELLRQMGCDQLQGFLLSRPLPPDRLTKLLLSAATPLRSVG